MGDTSSAEGDILKGVIWCRQVDNEAESPWYTPSPTSFDGLAESLPRAKIVGDLAINFSDTSDYWDPDPRRRLSFYKNLFLYPSAGGEYICMGRMFLSTEDRPRLGVKTVVLDAHALYASGNAGGLLRNWYSEMGQEPAPGDGGSQPPQALVIEMARALSGERLDPENPVVMALSKEWPQAINAAMAVMGRVPRSVMALSGVLLFPYFVPAGNVDPTIFSKTFPLSLAIFRMDTSLTMEQRKRRLDSWAKRGVTLVDLTSSPLKEPKRLPPVIQWISDPKEVQRQDRMRTVIDDGVMEKLLSGKLDGDDGPFHRKEISRIYAAMEAIATKDKELLKPGKKAIEEREVPQAPAEISWQPPWGEQKERARVDRAGEVVRQPTVTPLPPMPSPKPAPAPGGYISREDMIRYVDGKLADELTKIFTSGEGPEAQRVNSEIETLHAEVKEMDERLKYFAERTLPLLKKTWARMDALDVKKGVSTKVSKDPVKDIEKLKEEVWEELRRMETDLTERSRHILERMEMNLQTQGRIWLTLVQQISRLTEERHAPRIEEQNEKARR